MTCPHTLSGGPLVCTLDAGHSFGHVFRSGSGSEVDDRHGADGGHG